MSLGDASDPQDPNARPGSYCKVGLKWLVNVCLYCARLDAVLTRKYLNGNNQRIRASYIGLQGGTMKENSILGRLWVFVRNVWLMLFGLGVLVGLFQALFGGADRNTEGTIVEAGTLDVFSVRVGDCFNSDLSAETESVSSMPAVPCDEPHDAEAYDLFNVANEVWPGDEEMQIIGSQRCFEGFEVFVGREYESSVLDIFVLSPTMESFARQDREIVCAVYHMEGEKLVGSMRGSGR